jgi:23S rRNA (uridine2552-2'-O)-methyltransferase
MGRRLSKQNQWADHYTQQAKKDHFPARSVYKLQEIQTKYRVLKSGAKVLDLGCSPGSWAVYAAKIIGTQGCVIGIDQQKVTVTLPQNVSILKADVFKLNETILKTIGSEYDTVMSDMAPATTGNKHTDSARSYNLCQAALTLAQDVLKPGGHLVCKIFQGEDFQTFIDDVRKGFQKHRIFKPKSSRKASKEIYIIGLSRI